MPTSQEIYDKIEKLRLEKGMTVSQLNKLAGISHCTLNTWKTRQTMPKIEVLDSLCYALGTTISAVLADIDCDKLAGDMSTNCFLFGDCLIKNKRMPL